METSIKEVMYSELHKIIGTLNYHSSKTGTFIAREIFLPRQFGLRDMSRWYTYSRVVKGQRPVRLTGEGSCCSRGRRLNAGTTSCRSTTDDDDVGAAAKVARADGVRRARAVGKRRTGCVSGGASLLRARLANRNGQGK